MDKKNSIGGADVVSLRPPEIQEWVCLCGCRSFFLNSDGSSECTSCGEDDIDDSGWFEKRPDAPLETKDFDGTTISHRAFDTADFSKRAVIRDAGLDDVKVVIVLQANGTVTHWADPERGENFGDWVADQTFLAVIAIGGESDGA